MIAFENDIFPRQITAKPAAARPVAGTPAARAPARMAGKPPAGGLESTGFRGVFEAEVRSLPPRTDVRADVRAGARAGARAASAAQQPAANNGGFQPVFENDVLPALPASQTARNVPLWDNGGFGFSDVLDVINPLQHLPVISAIYRAETGDKIGAIPRILGSMLYGGGLVGAVVGAATAAVNIAVEQETGKDIGAHIYTALFGEGGSNATTTTIAATPAAKAAAAAAKGKAPIAVPQPVAAKTAIPPAAPKAKPVPAPAAAPAAAAPAVPAPVAAPKALAPAAKAALARSGVRVSGNPEAKTNLSTAAAQAVTSQFRRSTWYRKNQDVLNAQARELARTKAAAAGAAKNTAIGGGAQAKSAAPSRPDMLRLFTGKAAAAAKSGTASAKSKAASGPQAVPKAAMASEMSKALVKYEQLLKSRVAGAPKAGQLR